MPCAPGPHQRNEQFKRMRIGAWCDHAGFVGAILAVHAVAVTAAGACWTIVAVSVHAKDVYLAVLVAQPLVLWPLSELVSVDLRDVPRQVYYVHGVHPIPSRFAFRSSIHGSIASAVHTARPCTTTVGAGSFPRVFQTLTLRRSSPNARAMSVMP